MTISARVDYACRALLELASHYETGQPVPLRQISSNHNLPAQFLAQILQQLKSVGLIHSTRGAAGGYQLARPPSSISLWEVVVAIEGAGTAGAAGQESSAFVRCLRQVWDELAEQRQAQLRETTLQQLVEAARVESGSMYYI